jgi:hypothetical protein
MLIRTRSSHQTEPVEPSAELRRVAVEADAAIAVRESGEVSVEDVWRDLTLARWAVVDAFDVGGRRYLIARRAEGGDPALDTFDRIILARRAAGTALKVIASELGFSISTIGRRLQSAMGRLGLRSVAELAALFSRVAS